MNPGHEESRPRQESGSVSSTTEHVTRPGDIPLLARRHDFGLLVVAVRSDGIVVSQVYTNLPAAERKVTRSRDRGLTATMTLVRLVPVSHLFADDLALVGGLR